MNSSDRKLFNHFSILLTITVFLREIFENSPRKASRSSTYIAYIENKMYRVPEKKNHFRRSQSYFLEIVKTISERGRSNIEKYIKSSTPNYLHDWLIFSCFTWRTSSASFVFLSSFNSFFLSLCASCVVCSVEHHHIFRSLLDADPSSQSLLQKELHGRLIWYQQSELELSYRIYQT